MRTFDQDELAQGDGQDGRPTLVAVDGKVYDLTGSPMWTGGKHVKTHTAGQDLSLGLQAAPHGAEVMERYAQVGELTAPGKPVVVKPFPSPPPLFAYLLGLHPHPVTVHFPIALSVSAALFMLAYLVLQKPALETAALLNLGVATITSPPAIFAGMLSWYYNYGGIWTPIFRKKAVLSVALTVVTVGALLARLVQPESFGPEGTLHWLYAAAVVVTAPTVISLGFLGGNITFPR